MKVAGENVTVPHVDKAFFWHPQITQMAAVSFWSEPDEWAATVWRHRHLHVHINQDRCQAPAIVLMKTNGKHRIKRNKYRSRGRIKVILVYTLTYIQFKAFFKDNTIMFGNRKTIYILLAKAGCSAVKLQHIIKGCKNSFFTKILLDAGWPLRWHSMKWLRPWLKTLKAAPNMLFKPIMTIGIYVKDL